VDAYFTYAATASKIADDVTNLLCVEYVIPTYSTLVLLSCTFLAKNVDYLTSLNKI